MGNQVAFRGVAGVQWAERLLEGGGSEQWGDKWEERFKHGAGGKQVRQPLPLPLPLQAPAPVFLKPLGRSRRGAEPALLACQSQPRPRQAPPWLTVRVERSSAVLFARDTSTHCKSGLRARAAGRDLDAVSRGRALPALVGRRPLWQRLGAQARQLHHWCDLFPPSPCAQLRAPPRVGGMVQLPLAELVTSASLSSSTCPVHAAWHPHRRQAILLHGGLCLAGVPDEGSCPGSMHRVKGGACCLCM